MRLALAALCLAPLPALADAHAQMPISAAIVDQGGDEIGSIAVMETASGLIHLTISAERVAPGIHGIHLHETGECEGDFSSAGGHIAGDAQHGLVEGGPHPGDLPNAHVHDDGILEVEVFNHLIEPQEHLFDADGSAFIIHAMADDYASQPSGAAGDRVACAVLAPAS